MDIPSVVAQLEHLTRQPVVQAGGRVMFEQLGAALIAGSPLTPDGAEAAAARLALGLPVILASSRDGGEATRLCRQAALRLTGSSCYSGVVEFRPAPIAREMHAQAACLAGHGRAHPSLDATLQRSAPARVQCWGTDAENCRDCGKRAAREPTWS